MLIETCAGLLDRENPRQCITRELREETGFEIHNVRKVMEAYMSPGSVTEILHFFVAEYTPAQRGGRGEAAVEEEDIEVLELTIDEAEAKIASGEIRDGKTDHAAAVRSAAYFTARLAASRTLPATCRG